MNALITMLVTAALTAGILADLVPERVSNQAQGVCIIRCFEGHCERCCKVKGQWVCS